MDELFPIGEVDSSKLLKGILASQFAFYWHRTVFVFQEACRHQTKNQRGTTSHLPNVLVSLFFQFGLVHPPLFLIRGNKNDTRANHVYFKITNRFDCRTA